MGNDVLFSLEKNQKRRGEACAAAPQGGEKPRRGSEGGCEIPLCKRNGVQRGLRFPPYPHKRFLGTDGVLVLLRDNRLRKEKLMLIKMLQVSAGPKGTLQIGDRVEVSDSEGRMLIAGKYAVQVGGDPPVTAEPAVQVEKAEPGEPEGKMEQAEPAKPAGKAKAAKAKPAKQEEQAKPAEQEGQAKPEVEG